MKLSYRRSVLKPLLYGLLGKKKQMACSFLSKLITKPKFQIKNFHNLLVISRSWQLSQKYMAIFAKIYKEGHKMRFLMKKCKLKSVLLLTCTFMGVGPFNVVEVTGADIGDGHAQLMYHDGIPNENWIDRINNVRMRCLARILDNGSGQDNQDQSDVFNIRSNTPGQYDFSQMFEMARTNPDRTRVAYLEEQISLYRELMRTIIDGFDTITFVLGETRNGKSVFVNTLACQELFVDMDIRPRIVNGRVDVNLQLTQGNTAESFSPRIYFNDHDGVGHTGNSETFIPLPYILNERELILDCPGFNDTRSLSHQIAIASFIKELMELGKPCRFVAIVSEETLGIESRTRFLDFVRSVESFLPNITQDNSNLIRSFLLIQTKSQNRQPQEVSNVQSRLNATFGNSTEHAWLRNLPDNNIASFPNISSYVAGDLLQKILQSGARRINILGEGNENEEIFGSPLGQENRNLPITREQLINIIGCLNTTLLQQGISLRLLNENGQNPSHRIRLGLNRPALQRNFELNSNVESKLTGLPYVSMVREDYRLPIGERFAMQLTPAIDAINAKISHDHSAIARAIIGEITHNMEHHNSSDLQRCTERLSILRQQLEEHRTLSEDNRDYDNYLLQLNLQNRLERLATDALRQRVEQCQQLINMTQFMNHLLPEQEHSVHSRADVAEVVRDIDAQIRRANDYRDEIEQWNHLKGAIYDTLLRIEIQNDKARWREVHSRGYAQFLADLHSGYSPILSTFFRGTRSVADAVTLLRDSTHQRNIRKTALQQICTQLLNETNEVRNNVLQQNMQDPRRAERRIDRHNVIIEGEIVRARDIAHTIQNNNLNTQDGSIHEISVYANRAFLMDEALNLPGINLSILTPPNRFVINRDQTINLNGLNSHISATGRGDSGHPGGAGGHLFLYGITHDAFNNLQIHIRGGRGTDGAQGQDGQPKPRENDARIDQVTEHDSRDGDARTKLDTDNGHDDIEMRMDKHVRRGDPGQTGSPSGTRGAAGLPGCGGRMIICFADRNERRQEGENGDVSQNGNSGTPGEGSQAGRSAFSHRIVDVYGLPGWHVQAAIFLVQIQAIARLEHGRAQRLGRWKTDVGFSGHIESNERGPRGQTIDTIAPAIPQVVNGGINEWEVLAHFESVLRRGLNDATRQTELQTALEYVAERIAQL